MDDSVKSFMNHEMEMCLATVRRDGRPHAVPLGFIYEAGAVYFLTSESKSVTARSIAVNQRAVAVVHKDERAVIVEGSARFVKDRVEIERLRGLFLGKYPYWSELKDPELPGRVLVEARADKTLTWGV